MFPSSNSYIAVPYTDQAMFDKSIVNDVSPHSHSKLHLPSSFFEFSPTTFIDPNDDDIEFFQQHHHHHTDLFMTHLPKPFSLPSSTVTVAETTDINMTSSSNNKINNNNLMDETAKKTYPLADQMPKKSIKKDRHSKIVTAQGPRDRRMRLSLEVARKFFSLQDMLGFDKASKTIEWLLTKSKLAIKELSRSLSQTKNSSSLGNKSVSSTSECEVLSGNDDIANNNEDHKVLFEARSLDGICKEKRVRHSRKPKFHPLAKESRAKARERARERTKEKIWSRSQLCPNANVDELNQLRSSSPFETGEEESGSHSHDMKSSLEVVADQVEELSSHSLDNIVGESFVIASNSSPSSIFDYHNEIAISSHGMNPEFTENWDMDTNRSQYSYCAMSNIRPSTGNVQECMPSPFSLFQSQFADIQFNSKPWETTYNNQSLCRR